MKRKTIAILLICLFSVVLLAGCGGSGQQPAQTQPAQTQPAKTEQKQPASGAASALKAPEFEQSVLIVSIGQSADGQMVKALAERNGLKFVYDPVAKADKLGGDIKTLALVIGGSSKGMGAAGVNMGQEEQRAKDLIAKAKAGNMKIIMLHVGGEQRRGDLTDRFIALLSDCNYGIVVASGDKDKAFTKAAGGKIPLDFPEKVTDVGQYLKGAFK